MDDEIIVIRKKYTEMCFMYGSAKAALCVESPELQQDIFRSTSGYQYDADRQKILKKYLKERGNL